jgi:hypothetical protein
VERRSCRPIDPQLLPGGSAASKSLILGVSDQVAADLSPFRWRPLRYTGFGEQSVALGPIGARGLCLLFEAGDFGARMEQVVPMVVRNGFRPLLQ